MSLYRHWILASRPWSFSMTAISISVGAALAAVDGSFHPFLYLATLIGGIAAHAGTNLLNDYHDVQNGVDTPEAATAQYRPHPMVEGLLPVEKVRVVAYALFGLAFAVGLGLAMARGWMVLAIGVVGLAAGICYTAPPLRYKYSAMGEPAVFLMWGPLMVEGAYFIQAQSLSWKALWVSLPFGVLVALVLLANNIRDVQHDAKRAILTLPMVVNRLLGPSGGMRAFIALIGLAYLTMLSLVLSGLLTAWTLVIFLTLPLALKLARQMATQVPADADARTAKLDTAFGVLLALSLALEAMLG